MLDKTKVSRRWYTGVKEVSSLRMWYGLRATICHRLWTTKTLVLNGMPIFTE